MSQYNEPEQKPQAPPPPPQAPPTTTASIDDYDPLIQNQRPRYFVPWFDKWLLLIPVALVLIALLLLLASRNNAKPNATVLNAPPPGTVLQVGQPLYLTGTAQPNTPVKLYSGDQQITQTQADDSGSFQVGFLPSQSGPYDLKAVATVNNADVPSEVIHIEVLPAVAGQPTAPSGAVATAAVANATAVAGGATSVPNLAGSATLAAVNATAVAGGATSIASGGPGAVETASAANATAVAGGATSVPGISEVATVAAKATVVAGGLIPIPPGAEAAATAVAIENATAVAGGATPIPSAAAIATAVTIANATGAASGSILIPPGAEGAATIVAAENATAVASGATPVPPVALAATSVAVANATGAASGATPIALSAESAATVQAAAAAVASGATLVPSGAAGAATIQSEATSIALAATSQAPVGTPLPPAVTTAAANANITPNVNPPANNQLQAGDTLTGTGVPGGIVTIFLGTTPIGTATVGPDGTWHFVVPSGLAPGTTDLYVSYTNGVGTQLESPRVQVTVSAETSPANTPSTSAAGGGTPPATSIASASSAPTVNSPPDGQLKAGDTISGTALPGSTVTISLGSSPIGTSTVGPDGTWQAVIPAGLSPGSYDLSVSYTDASGKQVTSPPMPVTVTAGSNPPAITPSTSAAGAAAAPPSINPPPNNQLKAGDTLTGTAPPASTVSIYLGATAIGTAGAGADGSWQYVIPAGLPPGTHDLYVSYADANGKQVESPRVQVTVEGEAIKPAAAPPPMLPVTGAEMEPVFSLSLLLIAALIFIAVGFKLTRV